MLCVHVLLIIMCAIHLFSVTPPASRKLAFGNFFFFVFTRCKKDMCVCEYDI